MKLLNAPDYAWYAGCFGTASGNLIGFWDRNGLPDMYTGPTGGGVAPLNTVGANGSIRALWASQGGVDGRPAGQPGHIEDYWESQDGTGSFESTALDPYMVFGRAEHTPDCLGDFIGQSQRKYSDLNGECSGNIDGFAFNYWDRTGNRRTNFVPPATGGVAVRDIQSGLRAWSRYRGYEATVSSQLADVNPETPVGAGFTFEDIRAEINAGYPVMLMLQNHNEFSRPILPGMPRANPPAHAVVVTGYVVTDGGETRAIRFLTSWGDGETLREWNSDLILANLPMRGAITFHPQPKIKKVERTGNIVRMEWEGPNAMLFDHVSGATTPAHNYVIERASVLEDGSFYPVTEIINGLEATFSDSEAKQAFFRVRLTSGQ
ncbi:MAG: hypothetical protein ACXW3Z_00810 [Limisphaerales bacterium]